MTLDNSCSTCDKLAAEQARWHTAQVAGQAATAADWQQHQLMSLTTIAVLHVSLATTSGTSFTIVLQQPALHHACDERKQQTRCSTSRGHFRFRGEHVQI